MCDLTNFNFSARRGHRRAYKCVLAIGQYWTGCVYLPKCVLCISDVHAQIGAWCGQCPPLLACMNWHGSMVRDDVNNV